MEKIRVSKVENVQVIRRGVALTGTLHLTSHHIIFSHIPPTALEQPLDEPLPKVRPREIWITYPIISVCTYRPAPPGSGLSPTIRLRCRDFTFLAFQFSTEQEAKDVYESIRSLTCRIGRIEKLYAFSYRPQRPEKEINGWDIYSAMQEWKRQGISEKSTDKGWRISKLNVDYKFSPTYPALLPVPTSISDNVLNYAGRYRSRARIPTLSYLHPINNCSITRSSQPLAGFRGNRSIQDEKLVSAIFSSSQPNRDIPEPLQSSPPKISPSPSQGDLTTTEITDTEALEDELIASMGKESKITLSHIYGAQQSNLIVDARPTVNAMAMQAVGLGSENMDHYRFATKAYLGIDNIHVMRDSLNKVIDAIKDTDITPLPPNRESLVKSNWLKHITGLLEGSSLIARQVGLQHSHVLIHCSDGWDRTSQLSALSQICLDPYYRTIEGFIVLVEKDWLSFGHMFRHRSGFLSSEKWFIIENERIVPSNTQNNPNDDGPTTKREGKNALENALLSAKGFFNKDNASRESFADSDSEFGAQDSPEGKKYGGTKVTIDKETTKVKETSPVFHQFLDATYQLLYQNPTRFEFNERFLRRLLYHLFSCQYGTFLYDSEKSRIDANLREKTRSVWDYFLSRRGEFENPEYDGGIIDDHVKGKERLIFPRVAEIRWWNELFGRTDEEMNGKDPVPTTFAQDRLSNVGILTGVETSDEAVGITVERKGASNGGVGSAIAEGFKGLGITRPAKGIGPGSSNPKKVMELEMQ